MANSLLLIFSLLLLFPLSAKAEDWTQDAHDAQRTGSTPDNPAEPWTFKWSWNGADANGGTGNHLYDAPKEARTVTGGNNIYVPAGARGIYALAKTTGTQAWNVNVTSFTAAPAYSAGFVYAGGSDGKLYKINADTGAFATYTAGSPITKAILIVEPYVFAVSDDGRLHKISTTSLTNVWAYSAGSTAATPPGYSTSRNIIIFATDDLNVHAVNNSNGSLKWKTKPTPNTPGFPNEFELGWPVVADQHGLVFARMRLTHNALWAYPSTGQIFPNDQNTAQTWLTNNPAQQNLFALNLDDGTKKFIPAVGFGSTEDYLNGAAYGAMGSQPAVKVWPNGNEVVYIPFRNGQSNPPDGRWDSHMGEMVLDTTTVPGLPTGQLRFLRTSRENGGGGYDFITDEQTPVTLAGNTIFNSHWSATSSHIITNRAATLGLTYTSPIQTSIHPPIIRAQTSCGTKDTVTRKTTCAQYFTDSTSGAGRYYGDSGWWAYWGVADPPGWRIGSGNTAGNAYSAGFLPRYTYVSNNLIVVEGNGGDLMVFTHSGTVSTATPTPAPTSTPLLGDANSDGRVNGQDYVIWLTHYAAPAPAGPTDGDFNTDGTVNGQDYVIWLTHYAA